MTLLSIHGMLAAMTKTPEIALEVDEAKQLAHAIAEVSKHYPIPVMTDKQVALGMLAVTVFTVYRGKFVAIKARGGKPPAEKAKSAPAAPVEGTDNVFQFAPMDLGL